MSAQPELSERQREILARVVEEYVATSAPVGSKLLLERSGFAVSSSTIRAELAELERLGLLTHPHTSAGRVPTEAGYRVYVDVLLARPEPRPAEFPLALGNARAEVDEALQVTTETLSQVTRLLALVSAPPLEAATIRHVDVLQLQANVVVVVVITSTGEVTKQRYTFPEALDPGLVTWAGEYLRDRVTGLRPKSRMLARAFEEPELSMRERAFLTVMRGAFDDLEDERELYVGGAAGLLDDLRDEEMTAYRSLIDALEKRAALLDILAQSLGLRRPFVRVGGELEESGLHKLALVGASYGYANQTLGTVSLLGPLRMDYEKALRAVRFAAYELSRFVEAVYADE
jgi:heat-inducible transcriptional repressor